MQVYLTYFRYEQYLNTYTYIFTLFYNELVNYKKLLYHHKH